jgi:hypothetical protein
MVLKLGVGLLTLVLLVSVPAHAQAVGQASSQLEGKGLGAPLPVLNSTDIPTLGGTAASRVVSGQRPGSSVPTLGVQATTPALGVQVNDPALDNIQFFPNALPQPQRPYEFSIQSETSAAAFGNDVVVGFNNSADQPVVLTPRNTVAFVHRFLSGVGVSHDGGHSWTESSLPPIPGSPFTFGDPALAVDRQGNFYYASLGADAAGRSLIFVGKSTDGGRSWQPGVTVAVDPGSDKDWIAAGPDPLHPTRDNVYVTWTSFKAASSQLMLGRSTDGGQTWTVSTLFAPVDNGVESSFLQFSNPVVDQATGRLYVPFLHGGDGDADFIKVLISDDGGQTFRFGTFNQPGVADPTALPNVTPGTLADCGVNGGFRTVLHTGPDLGGGRFGLPVFRDATRLITQPSTAVLGGVVAIAFNASTSPTFGDPASTSEIHLIYSLDGGGTWRGPFTIVPATSTEPQHVHPSISLASSGNNVKATVGYYTQLASGQLRVDAARVLINTNGNQSSPPVLSITSLGPPFALIPSDNPLPAVPFGPHRATNYDRTIQACYDIGEYMTAVPAGHQQTFFAWGDNRNSWTGPAASVAPGTHSQPDVFAARITVGD